jgi:fused
MKLLCSLMRDNQLLSVQEWPVVCGGGPEATQELIITILKLFNLPFNHQVYDKEVDEISSGLAKADIIYLTLNALKFLGAGSIPIGVTLISKLVFSAESSKQFAQ